MTVASDKQTSSSRARQRRAKAQAAAQAARQAQRRRALTNKLAAAIAVAVVLAGLYVVYQSGTEAATTTAQPGDYEVGSPGPGEQAPDFTLTAANGDQVSLSDFRGENVLLYVHEGLGCQPCWDQIRDLEKDSAKLESAGIDWLVSITSAPPDLLAQKMRDDNLDSLALADANLEMIRQYEANKYGMMGDTRAGHSFILVNREGEIVWRADYGGAPKYRMYLPVDRLLADLAAGRVDA